MTLTEQVKAAARASGFDLVGIARAEPLEVEEPRLLRWLDAGRHGTMAWLARDPTRRTRPARVLPGAQSLIALGVQYAGGDAKTPSPPPAASEGTGGSAVGRVSCYAWGQDYHDVIESRLKVLEQRLATLLGPKTALRSYVDHGPVLERAVAQRAGLGFIGKHTLLITRSFGSWIFLAVILTTARLEPDRSDAGPPDPPDRADRGLGCGTCRLCLDACPTGAITAPYELDARRCISYLTIELRETIPVERRHQMGDWLFGCDICQEVCPYNRQVPAPTEPAFRPEAGIGPRLPLNQVLDIRDEARFQDAFRGTPLLRPGRSGLVRNAAVVAGNLTAEREALKAAAGADPNPIVRKHAAWALGREAGPR